MWRASACGGLLVIALCGCGQQAVTGGTPGRLLAAGEPLGDIQILLYRLRDGAPEPVGLAVTGFDGTFALVTSGAQGPLQLSPGEYCCTLESVGAPVRLAEEYARPETTPLRFTWPGATPQLLLELPSVVPDTPAPGGRRAVKPQPTRRHPGDRQTL